MTSMLHCFSEAADSASAIRSQNLRRDQLAGRVRLPAENYAGLPLT
jgi:hypothetical protein